jgi:hypothetical protein
MANFVYGFQQALQIIYFHCARGYNYESSTIGPKYAAVQFIDSNPPAAFQSKVTVVPVVVLYRAKKGGCSIAIILLPLIKYQYSSQRELQIVSLALLL